MPAFAAMFLMIDGPVELQMLRRCITQDSSASLAVASEKVESYVAEKYEEMAARPATYKEVFTSLLGCIPEEDSGAYDDETASAAVTLAMSYLFGLGFSQSGAQVQVRSGSAGGTHSVGVLVLGFGGASMRLLAPVDAAYAELEPSWRTVMTTLSMLPGERFDRMVEAQMHEAAEALSAVNHVIVHSMSNNVRRPAPPPRPCARPGPPTAKALLRALAGLYTVAAPCAELALAARQGAWRGLRLRSGAWRVLWRGGVVPDGVDVGGEHDGDGGRHAARQGLPGRRACAPCGGESPAGQAVARDACSSGVGAALTRGAGAHALPHLA